MPTIKAFRMDGLGNKFVIVDRRKDIVNITKEKIIHLGNLKSFHREIGFDQIIFIEREIDKAFPITIFNSDGGEVSACGNGSRCVAYLLGKDLNTKEVKLKTNNRLLNAKIVGHLDVELAMGKPIFEWNKIPLSENLDHSNIALNIEDKVFTDGFCLNVGNAIYIFSYNPATCTVLLSVPVLVVVVVKSVLPVTLVVFVFSSTLSLLTPSK